MIASFNLWLEYLLRFSHLVAGIAWIGSSFYFIWLDSSFLPPVAPRRNVEGEVFMVHGGFYYQVEKKKIYPGELPDSLHWFKWEATLTWITGFLLLIVVYFMRGASLLIDPRIYQLTQVQAITLTLTMVAVSWFYYDFVWLTRWIKQESLRIFLSVIYFGSLIYFSTRIFSGRGSFILIGAVFGTLMVLNVWIRILPGQGKMLKEAQEGRVPDYSVSLKSKVRSVHNTYFTFPVLFIMLSNHYPAVYSHPKSWLLLIILGVSGALVRHAMVTKKEVERWTLLPASIGLLALVFTTAHTGQVSRDPVIAGNSGPVNYQQVSEIVSERCLRCHSSKPTDEVFKVAPNNVIFDSESALRQYKDKIIQRVGVDKTMPLMNKTNMTNEERAMLIQWLNQ
jgi:uncharacterized membrane protein